MQTGSQAAADASAAPGAVNIWGAIRRWFLIAIIAVANITAIGVLTAQAQGVQLNLFDVVSIFADCVGVTTGLLGIWFFMFSESLNRTTSTNLQRTTEVVGELRGQMWRMIEQTFALFVRSEDRESAKEAEQAIRKLKESGLASADELEQATAAIIRRLEVLERQREFSSLTFHSAHSVSAAAPTFYPGEKIRHESFGPGVVVSSRFDSAGEEVTIAFLYDDIRRLRVNLAEIKRVKEFAGPQRAGEGASRPTEYINGRSA